MLKILGKIFKSQNDKTVEKLSKIVDKINLLEEEVASLSDEELRLKTDEFKSRLNNGETEDDILPEAFAVVREASKRTLGLRHYDVQLMGGIVMHRGEIAEMKTGEGKTLSATLPVYLNALSGKGVHLVTVNDYLAKRDVQWMGQIYDFLGMTTGVIVGEGKAFKYDAEHIDEEEDKRRDEEGSYRVFEEFLKPVSRKEAYRCDILYGTNNEFGFDYLRDNTQTQKEGVTQREHHYCIVDEIDSVLIDEARVPLILSSQAEYSPEIYRKMVKLAMIMVEGDDYEIDEKYKAVKISLAGISKAEKYLGVDNLYSPENIKLIHYFETAVKAKALYLKDRDYIVKNGEVYIIDPFTGRIQEGRRWSDGLHQAIEAKEGVEIKKESKTIASITYQNYFRMYKKLSGMTGTAFSSKEEFEKVYGLDVVVIPTNKPIARKDHTDLIFQTEHGKFTALARKVKELQEKGQPVLVGTVSVEKNEVISGYFKKYGIKHSVLNAKNHREEGEIIARAGEKGAVTVATNMAGRGVDIKLGGVPRDKDKEEEIKNLGGLFVIGTERHEARRIDDQLRGRAGRQGDPGESRFYVSLEDPLMRIFGADSVKGFIKKLGLKEDEPIVNKFISNQIEKAQNRIEGMHFDARKHVLEYDDVLSHHRNLIYGRRRKILFEDKNEMDKFLEEVLADEFVKENYASAIIEKLNSIEEKTKYIYLRRVILWSMDKHWMEHLTVMESAKKSVMLRAYGQREPLVEYKKESLRLFKEMEVSQRRHVAVMMANANMERVKVMYGTPEEREEAKKTLESKANNARRDSAPETEVSPKEEPDKKYVIKMKNKIKISKNGRVKYIKPKKLEEYIEAGWKKLS